MTYFHCNQMSTQPSSQHFYARVLGRAEVSNCLLLGRVQVLTYFHCNQMSTQPSSQHFYARVLGRAEVSNCLLLGSQHFYARVLGRAEVSNCLLLGSQSWIRNNPSNSITPGVVVHTGSDSAAKLFNSKDDYQVTKFVTRRSRLPSGVHPEPGPDHRVSEPTRSPAGLPAAWRRGPPFDDIGSRSTRLQHPRTPDHTDSME